MSQMVVPHYRIAVLCEETGKGVVAADMLGNAVDQLDHRLRGAGFGQPLHRVDLVEAVAGGKSKFLQNSHGKYAPSMLK